MIPEWLDAQALQSMLAGALVALAVLAALVMRLVRKIVLRVALVAVLAAVAASLWLQRAELRECLDTCSCTLFAQQVTIPADKNANCANGSTAAQHRSVGT